MNFHLFVFLYMGECTLNAYTKTHTHNHHLHHMKIRNITTTKIRTITRTITQIEVIRSPKFAMCVWVKNQTKKGAQINLAMKFAKTFERQYCHCGCCCRCRHGVSLALPLPRHRRRRRRPHCHYISKCASSFIFAVVVQIRQDC